MSVGYPSISCLSVLKRRESIALVTEVSVLALSGDWVPGHDNRAAELKPGGVLPPSSHAKGRTGSAAGKAR